MTQQRDLDVLVVGAGPAGLTVAGDLARAGRTVAVLERRRTTDPVDMNAPVVVHARTLELLDARDLADDVLATARALGDVALGDLVAVDLTRLASDYRFAAVTTRAEVLQALAAYARTFGAEIHCGIEVTGLSQDDLAAVVSGADGVRRRARYVVAADGADSTVRRLLGAGLDPPGAGWLRRLARGGRQVARYRHGRVFLAGDAACVPCAGSEAGVDRAISDGADLGWKLDAVLGGALHHVVRTYHDERHAAGRRELVRAGMLAWTAARPSPARDALLRALLHVAPVRDAVAGRIAGTALRYPRQPGQHWLVGTSAAAVPLVGVRLTELQRTPGFVLVREHGTRRPRDAEGLLHA